MATYALALISIVWITFSTGLHLLQVQLHFLRDLDGCGRTTGEL